MTSTVPDGALGWEEGAITGCRLFRKELPAPTRSEAHSQFMPRECTSVAFKLFTFNAPIKNWLNHRRKCAAINPYEMTLIMWCRQK